MPSADAKQLLFFVRQQREMMQLQADAIDRGDFPTAISTGVKLNAAKGEWARVISAVKAGEWNEVIDAEVRTAVKEMLLTHERLLAMLEPERDTMAELLSDVRRGKQVLSGYRMSKRGHRLQFETRA